MGEPVEQAYGAGRDPDGDAQRAPSVEATLAERGARYGDFSDHADIAQKLQDLMREWMPRAGKAVPDRGWEKLSAVQKQALTVIADKVARILNGDPNYADNWHDIQGYAKLAEDRIASDLARVPERQRGGPPSAMPNTAGGAIGGSAPAKPNGGVLRNVPRNARTNRAIMDNEFGLIDPAKVTG